MKTEENKLLPERHPTPDFFIADIFDNIPFKDDIASMEHPMFSLSKNKDMRTIQYQNGDVSVYVKPNIDGLPTIFDKDVLLYCASYVMNEINRGKIPPKTLRISTRDLLVATNRPTNGDSYTRLRKALDRLTGVKIKTNIKTNGREITRAFGLIDGYEIIESSRVKERMVRLEITLSDWIYNSLLGKEVLTINRNYFRLAKPLERRLYEIARKLCGAKKSSLIGLAKLKEKTGSTSSLAKFKYFIKEQVKLNHLPDYIIDLSDREVVTFIRRQEFNPVTISQLPVIHPDTIIKAKNIIDEAQTDWSYQSIAEQFTEQLQKGFTPDKVDGAFLNFVKKKIKDSAKKSIKYS